MSKLFNLSLAILIGFVGMGLFESCGVFGGSGGSQGGLNSYSVVLGGQVSSNNGNILDLSNGNVMTFKEAEKEQKASDLVYAYGKNSKANFLAPKSNRKKAFGSLRRKIGNKWSVLNNGTFINLRDGKEAQKIFKKTKSRSALIANYEDGARTVRGYLDFKKSINGPLRSIRHIQDGDVVLFRSRSKDLYAIIKVESLKTGSRGEISLNVKAAAQ